MNKTEEYLLLMDKNYDEAVSYLLKKYGAATDDYFRENSYNRFMNSEIKSITKGKTTRTSEGLYCHHIEENKYLKMTDFNYIKNQRIPFSAHTKDKLVYCNLVEHAILHMIIARETNNKYGKLGLDTYLKPMIYDWYVLKMIPNSGWQKHCYDKAFLNAKEAEEIIIILSTGL